MCIIDGFLDLCRNRAVFRYLKRSCHSDSVRSISYTCLPRDPILINHSRSKLPVCNRARIRASSAWTCFGICWQESCVSGKFRCLPAYVLKGQLATMLFSYRRMSDSGVSVFNIPVAFANNARKRSMLLTMASG